MTGISWQNIQMMGLDEGFTDYEHNKGQDGKRVEEDTVTHINSLEEHNAAMERINNKRK